MSEPPIKEANFVAGVTVVDFGDVRVARGLSRRPYNLCRHHSLVYDQQERRIWCKDCETNLDGFDAFLVLVENFNAAHSRVERRERLVADAEQHHIRSIAAKTMDEAWRSRKMVPCCPHCHGGLFPEHFRNRPAMVGKNYALALIKKRATEAAKPAGERKEEE